MKWIEIPKKRRDSGADEGYELDRFIEIVERLEYIETYHLKDKFCQICHQSIKTGGHAPTCLYSDEWKRK